MPATPASVSGVALRVAKLAQDGSPLPGTDTAYVTNAFMSMGFTPEYSEGDEVEEKAADGSVCVYFKLPDVLKRVTFTLQICSPSPELSEILVGGTLLEEVTQVIGYASPAVGEEATPNGIAIEVWSRAIEDGKPAAVNPYWRWLFPYAQLRFSGDRVLENGMLANTYEGWGLGNAQFGTGPTADWLYSSDRPFQYIRSATAPIGFDDYITVAS